jgi:N-acetylmuramoyl-L-alanine amidase
MTAIERRKRDLVRAAVQENLEIMHGRRPLRGRRRTQWSRLPLLLLGAGLLVTALAWRPLRARPNASPVSPFVAEAGPGLAGSTLDSRSSLDLALRLDSALSAPAPLDPAVLPLAVRTIVLDPGHGGAQLGTVAPGGLVEKDLALDISERLRERLVAARYRVLMTRDRDTAVELQDRAAAANAAGGDLFVSVHLNWIETRQRGVETYYLGPTDDPFLTRLAAAENRDSGYSYADFRRLLDGIYADLRREESRRLAESVQRRLHAALREVNPRLQDRGVKTAPFLVLVATGMPAILAEVSCLSNDEEVALLRDSAYRQRIADALYAGITGYVEANSSHPGPKGTDA